ncbi:hypothetical protein BpHYR1_047394 [Brachionus plicatilis]|uniref:Uncharacterized protein n=1 Tax=Brachionus plicatilis TaxID=10195 RepID=A0A3M7T610_BRAPC|nr:hypothetical protein BpHYR1_047394 [Brachionus plicatilis]
MGIAGLVFLIQAEIYSTEALKSKKHWGALKRDTPVSINKICRAVQPSGASHNRDRINRKQGIQNWFIGSSASSSNHRPYI